MTNSGNADTSRAVRLLALLTCRDEMRFLPGYFANLSTQVDGVVALDDGSTDGSADFIAGQALTLELIRLPAREPHVWDEPRNRGLLIEAAGRHGADWALAQDADERIEMGFRDRAEAVMAEARVSGTMAYAIAFRECWDAPDQYRVDGLWGHKWQARLFRMRSDPQLDERRLHGHWAPINSAAAGGFRQADLWLYHLRMVHAADRQSRRDRYLRLDPDRQFQAIGYDYLTDESGLQLAKIPPGREYQPMLSIPAS
jgi:hypothetical protein